MYYDSDQDDFDVDVVPIVVVLIPKVKEIICELYTYLECPPSNFDTTFEDAIDYYNGEILKLRIFHCTIETRYNVGKKLKKYHKRLVNKGDWKLSMDDFKLTERAKRFIKHKLTIHDEDLDDIQFERSEISTPRLEDDKQSSAVNNTNSIDCIKFHESEYDVMSMLNDEQKNNLESLKRQYKCFNWIMYDRVLTDDGVKMGETVGAWIVNRSIDNWVVSRDYRWSVEPRISNINESDKYYPSIDIKIEELPKGLITVNWWLEKVGENMNIH